MTSLMIVLLILALGFDFLNGIHELEQYRRDRDLF